MGKFNVREMMAPKESNTETVDRPRTVEQIAVEMGYDLRWLYRLHGKALDVVREITGLE